MQKLPYEQCVSCKKFSKRTENYNGQPKHGAILFNVVVFWKYDKASLLHFPFAEQEFNIEAELNIQ